MPLHITHDTDQIHLVHKANDILNEKLKKYLVDEGRPVLLLLSGGSDLSLLRCLDCINTELFSNLLTVSTLDERFSRASHENNFLQVINSSFYQEAEDAKVKFIRTVPEDRETLQEFTQRIEQEFRDWYEVNRDGKIIITQGIGVDGHTAGMNVTLNEKDFTDVFQTHSWLVGYTSNTLIPPKRITVTVPFLKDMVDTSVIYAVGDEKAWALRELVKEEFKSELFTLPARIVHVMREVHLFTDVDIL